MELGNTSSIKWFDGVGEYIIDWGPGYRICLAKDGDKLIVLFAGSCQRDHRVWETRNHDRQAKQEFAPLVVAHG
jgi:putative component of toxin-antitoxin plasmid stabilization module